AVDHDVFPPLIRQIKESSQFLHQQPTANYQRPPKPAHTPSNATMSSDEEDIDSMDEEEEDEVATKPKRRRKKKGKKDPNKPKRNMSAFFLYSNAHRERVKEENPNAKFGDIAKILSVEFKEISESERARWDRLAAQDKDRYMAAMETYEAPTEHFKALPEEERAYWDEKAAQDKERYQRDMEIYRS
ncbi:hypothetical protein ACHAXA_001508, partial [Cyclostephanos tholiformis]